MYFVSFGCQYNVIVLLLYSALYQCSIFTCNWSIIFQFFFFFADTRCALLSIWSGCRFGRISAFMHLHSSFFIRHLFSHFLFYFRIQNAKVQFGVGFSHFKFKPESYGCWVVYLYFAFSLLFWFWFCFGGSRHFKSVILAYIVHFVFVSRFDWFCREEEQSVNLHLFHVWHYSGGNDAPLWCSHAEYTIYSSVRKYEWNISDAAGFHWQIIYNGIDICVCVFNVQCSCSLCSMDLIRICISSEYFCFFIFFVAFSIFYYSSANLFLFFSLSPSGSENISIW